MISVFKANEQVKRLTKGPQFNVHWIVLYKLKHPKKYSAKCECKNCLSAGPYKTLNSKKFNFMNLLRREQHFVSQTYLASRIGKILSHFVTSEHKDITMGGGKLLVPSDIYLLEDKYTVGRRKISWAEAFGLAGNNSFLWLILGLVV